MNARPPHHTSDQRAPAKVSSASVLYPIIGVVFLVYLVIGIPLPVLPLHVHDRLGMSTFIVGVVAGSQFVTALLSRVAAGHTADGRGPKRAVVAGSLMASGSGLLYLLSWMFLSAPTLSVFILLTGRLLLGAAESFLMTGALTWGLARAGEANTGRVIAWVGTACNAAIAFGAPLGTALDAHFGFAAMCVVTAILPLVGLAGILLLPGSAPSSAEPPTGGMGGVARAIALPGFTLALGCVGFGAITMFVTLLFAQQGWQPTWLAISSWSFAFLFGRIFLGHLPDVWGGAKVAFGGVIVQAVGLALIWISGVASLAFVGTMLTGIGYSLVFPSLGVEAVQRTPPETRGLTMGVYSAFFDLSLGLTGPVLGFVADRADLASVFLAAAMASLASAILAARLLPSTLKRVSVSK